MPNPNKLRTGTATSEALQRQRREEAFDAANRTFVEKGRSACGAYVRRKLSADDIESLLKSCDVQFIPSFSEEYTKLDPQVEVAARSLSRLAVILNSLEATSPSNNRSSVASLEDLAFGLLVEYWPSVSKWIEFFLQCRSPAIRIEERNLSACLDLLLMVAGDGSDNTAEQHKAHICTMPCTGKNIIDALVLFDSGTSEYRMVRGENRAGQSAGPCLVVGLLRSLSKSPRVWDEALAAASRTHRTRRAVVDSLVGRAQAVVRMAREGEDIGWASRTLHRIALGVCRFTADFVDELKRKDAHCKVTEALSAIAEDGDGKRITDRIFWGDLGQAIAALVIISCDRESVNPLPCIEGVVTGGIIPCLLKIIKHVDQSTSVGAQVREAMNKVLLYFPASKVFIAAALRGDLGVFSEQPPASAAELDVTKIYDNWKMVSNLCSLAFGSDSDEVPANVCANLNHRFPSGFYIDLRKSNARPQTCSGCHSVIYCSKECQAQDWVAFHRHECRNATKAYQARKNAMIRLGSRMQTDQIKYLQTLVNFTFNLKSPSEIRQSNKALDMLNPAETWFGIRPEHARIPPVFSSESTIAVFDCGKLGMPFLHHPRISMASYHTVYWDSMDVPWWNSRIRQYVLDAEATPETIVLVEGVFRFDVRRDIAVLTKMEHRPNARMGHRYRVVSSLLRMSMRSVS